VHFILSSKSLIFGTSKYPKQKNHPKHDKLGKLIPKYRITFKIKEKRYNFNKNISKHYFVFGIGLKIKELKIREKTIFQITKKTSSLNPIQM